MRLVSAQWARLRCVSCAGALCEGQVVPSSRRRGADHRRVFRPRDGRAALVRRSAPERRGQRGAHCPAGDGGGRVGGTHAAPAAASAARH
eukprot:1339916-Pleurochrysis_carterae.AAC.2